MKKDPKLAFEVEIIFKLIKEIAPGKAVELRVPLYGAIQCVEGVIHRRGIPPNQVEMSAKARVYFAHSPDSWESFVSQGQNHASGHASDLSQLFAQGIA